MRNNKAGRRNFIKTASMGLGSLSFAPLRQPTENAVQKKLQIICVGAHPGDPEFGCGGTMAKYAIAGHSVTFLYLTRGEAYDPGKSFGEAAALRTKEAEQSCATLRAKPLFAGQIDGNTVLNKDKNEEMAKLILSEAPDLVFTHWPLDSHPDHQVAGLLTLTAWIKSGRKFRLYFYEVNTGSESMEFTPTDYVDISEVRDRKKQAMFAHVSQGPEEVYNNWFRKMEEFRGLEAGVKAAEAFIHFAAASPSILFP
jgi:LmbE family N-acetylglucosaminyl deacetylase